jgi:starch synthase
LPGEWAKLNSMTRQIGTKRKALDSREALTGRQLSPYHPESWTAPRIKDDRVPTSTEPLLEHMTDVNIATRDVVVACPDARPPAYQAVIGFERAGRLDRFVTGFYHRHTTTTQSRWFSGLDKKLARRSHPEIPSDRVVSRPFFDVCLAAENRVSEAIRNSIARLRTDRFDRSVLANLKRKPPRTLLAFSDVASEHTLPFCRTNGIRTVLSMVHGEVHEEIEVLEREQARSSEFFEIYLGNGPIDRRELAWLHDRRLRELELADLVLVPSDHIAGRLRDQGIEPDRIEVIPYAADTCHFTPNLNKKHDDTCRFLFAGGITQRKGIKDLLDAWQLIRRPGWTLQLLGAMPRDTRPLEPYRSDFEWLGRVGHSEMPSVMAAADVFVFPSLFEGSAVVTYEAMACGLPSIVTAESGSVAQNHRDGLIVPAADPVSLSRAMERLGSDPELRETMSHSARIRALEFDWTRYHQSLVNVLAPVPFERKEAALWT